MIGRLQFNAGRWHRISTTSWFSAELGVGWRKNQVLDCKCYPSIPGRSGYVFGIWKYKYPLSVSTDEIDRYYYISIEKALDPNAAQLFLTFSTEIITMVQRYVMPVITLDDFELRKDWETRRENLTAGFVEADNARSISGIPLDWFSTL